TAEIIEIHHDGKADSPSGTAVSTAKRMAAASNDWAKDPTTHEAIAGARGAKGPADIRIHAVRMRGAVANQEVVLGTQGQTLTIRHDTIDRASFMPGVVLACKKIAERDAQLLLVGERLCGLLCQQFAFGFGKRASSAHVHLDAVAFASRLNLIDEQHRREALGARQIAHGR
ncbi:MAG: hypothetical protein EBT17_06055, partial [Actinobacteria bacterium]|nr:hypothetical protein [Actinomycetota bacterium]